MNIQCPECNTKYRLKEMKTDSPQIRVRCKKCGTMFTVDNKADLKTPKSHLRLRRNVPPFFTLRSNITRGHMNVAGYWSYPSFIRMNGKQVNWLYLVLSMMPNHEKQITGLFRPKACIVSKPNSQVIVHFDDFRSGRDLFPDLEWDKPYGIYPHEKVKSFDYKSLAEKEQSLIAACEQESKRFAAGDGLSSTFVRQWMELTHPCMIQFLKHLAPEFVEGIARNITSAGNKVEG